MPFWRPLDFEGVHKSTIFDENGKHREKKEVPETYEKNIEFLIDFWSQTQGPDQPKKQRLTLDLLQSMKVGRSWNVMEKTMPKVIQIGLNIETLAAQVLKF